MNTKKAITRLVLAIAVSICAFGLFACAEKEVTDEDLIRESLSTELESIKALDETFMEEMTAGVDNDAFSTYGVRFDEFIAALLSGFDYSIDDVVISEDDDSAIATVTLTCRSFPAVRDAMIDAVATACEENDISNMKEQERGKLFGQAALNALSKVESESMDPIEVEYSKVDNVWIPSDGSEQVIVSALLMG